MSWFYRNILRPFLFAFDSEEIHNLTLQRLGKLSQSRLGLSILESCHGMVAVPVEVFGLSFPNPVGLAAGMDKMAQAVPAWERFGFGFCELGGVTALGQPGNPQPRMFRAVGDEALVNRMGFNNPGAEQIALSLDAWRKAGLWPRHPVGINLGKSKVTPLEKAAEDYTESFRLLRSFADFFVVNVSSPNTPNLRQLQDKEALAEVLHSIEQENARAGAPRRPVLVKIAPDLTFTALDEILEIAGPCNIKGIVATNTTVARPETGDENMARIYKESGGLSGKPLRRRSTEVIRHLHRSSGGSIPLVGVGGIFNAEDAWEKITAGASLVQVYTGMVYEGPSIAREICEGLGRKLGLHGLRSLKEAVGLENRS